MADMKRFRVGPRRQAPRWALGVGLLWTGVMGAIAADQTTPLTVVNPPGAPIECLEATGQLLEYQAVPTRRGGAARHTRTKYLNIRSSRGQVAHWGSRVRYRNNSTRRVSAIRFQWKLLDAFDQPQWVAEITDTDGLMPRETRERRWEQEVSQAENIVKALLAVKMVRFEDGTVWPPPPQDSQAPPPHEVIRVERKRLMELYEQQGLDALLRALHEGQEQPTHSTAEP